MYTYIYIYIYVVEKRIWISTQIAPLKQPSNLSSLLAWTQEPGRRCCLEHFAGGCLELASRQVHSSTATSAWCAREGMTHPKLAFNGRKWWHGIWRCTILFPLELNVLDQILEPKDPGSRDFHWPHARRFPSHTRSGPPVEREAGWLERVKGGSSYHFHVARKHHLYSFLIPKVIVFASCQPCKVHVPAVDMSSPASLLLQNAACHVQATCIRESCRWEKEPWCWPRYQFRRWAGQVSSSCEALGSLQDLTLATEIHRPNSFLGPPCPTQDGIFDPPYGLNSPEVHIILVFPWDIGRLLNDLGPHKPRGA